MADRLPQNHIIGRVNREDDIQSAGRHISRLGLDERPQSGESWPRSLIQAGQEMDTDFPHMSVA
jgi:hypothetical protein